MGRAARSPCLQLGTETGPTAVPTPSMASHAGLESLAGFYPISYSPRERVKQQHTWGGFRGTVLPREELTAHRYIWHWELDVPLLPLVLCCHLCTMSSPGDADCAGVPSMDKARDFIHATA